MNATPAPLPPPDQPGYPSLAALGFARGRAEFFWIAGLSLVNSLLTSFGAHVRFPVGMGVTAASDAIFNEVLKDGGNIAKLAAIAFSLFASGIVALFAWLTGRGNRVIFILGIVLYILDGVLCLVFQDWFSVAFHAWITFKLFQSWSQTRE